MSPAGNRRRIDLTLSAFIAIPTLPALAMIGALAVVARHSTVAEWSSLGIGASVGGVTALIVLYGWTLSGPVDVARAEPEQRDLLYWQSVADRCILLALAVTPSSACAWLIAPPGARETALSMALATCLNGFSALWFAVGVGRPGLCLKREVVPKTAGIVLGAAIVGTGGPVWMFAVGVATGSMIGLVALSRAIPAPPGGVTRSRRDAWSSLRARFTAGLSEVAAGGYSLAGAALVGMVGSPLVTALYVSADRVFRVGLITVSSLAGALQRGVSAAAATEFHARVGAALAAHAVLGSLGLVGLALLGRPISEILFGEDFVPPQSAMVAFGVAFLAVSLNTSLGRHVLASQGRIGALLAGTIVGVVLGVPAILIGTAENGVTGAAVGGAASEIAVLAVMSGAALRTSRRTRRQAG